MPGRNCRRQPPGSHGRQEFARCLGAVRHCRPSEAPQPFSTRQKRWRGKNDRARTSADIFHFDLFRRSPSVTAPQPRRDWSVPVEYIEGAGGRDPGAQILDQPIGPEDIGATSGGPSRSRPSPRYSPDAAALAFLKFGLLHPRFQHPHRRRAVSCAANGRFGQATTMPGRDG